MLLLGVVLMLIIGSHLLLSVHVWEADVFKLIFAFLVSLLHIVVVGRNLFVREI